MSTTDIQPISRNIFEPRTQFKPYEYPELVEFKDSIRQSYWIHTEFNYVKDVQDFRTAISKAERTALTRSMLAISQVEVTVKRFWADIFKYFPKPEIDMVGVTFAESEARHADAYSFLLETLGMNNLFDQIHTFAPLMERVHYMDEFMKEKNAHQRGFVMSLVAFSLFIEHISLFGQFFVMMSFNKHRNLFKGISNAIEATSKEEEIHGRFGIALYDILRREHNNLFTEDFYTELKTLADNALKAELGIIDWIFEEGDLDFCTREMTKNFITHRYNNSLAVLGINSFYEVNKEILKETEWFDIEVLSTKETDFFNKRSTDYSKRIKAITPDDLYPQGFHSTYRQD